MRPVHRFTTVVGALFPLILPLSAAADTADKIWIGGPILTMNDDAMRADAVAVKDGKIIAVGKKDDVLATKGDKTDVINLGGKALLPGFVDAHGHVMMGGLQALAANLLAPPDGKVTDIASLQQTMKDWVEANKEMSSKAKLILGFGYDQSQLKELRAPTKEELDAISTELPLVVVHQSGHFGALNSKALEVVGYTSETKDPDGGVIQRKPGTTEPNGVLEETAWIAVLPKLLGNIGPSGMAALAEAGANMWASYGYTTGQEGRSNQGLDSVFRTVADQGKLKIDIVSYPDILLGRDHIKDNVSPDYKNGFRIGGAKLTIDGSPQGFTAWRDRPYYAPIGNFPKGYLGYPAANGEQVISAIDWAYENNIQILTHVSGEAAGDLMISALRLAENKYGAGDRRPVLIHGHFEREDQVDSFVRLGVFPSLFPMHTYYWGDWHRDHTVGPELAQNISPTGWYLKRGSKFSTHHDAPVAFPDSMRILDATVTRRSRSGDIIGPLQRVDVITALKGMTIWPAYQHFEDKTKGSIETGKLADFVILSADPTTVEPDNLEQLTVAETVKKGNTIFVRGQKRTELMRPRDFVNTGFYETLKQIYVQERVRNLPTNYRTPVAIAFIAASYDDCFGSIMISEMMDSRLQAGNLAAQ
ncbi:MAG: amidohydrolase [Hyphomicrobium sp.]|nr:amidohydrolase [Hyphomicrobium sp.]